MDERKTSALALMPFHSLLLEFGVHPKIVQESLGHSNISTTMNIYSHVTPTMQKDAVARLSQLLS